MKPRGVAERALTVQESPSIRGAPCHRKWMPCGSLSGIERARMPVVGGIDVAGPRAFPQKAGAKYLVSICAVVFTTVFCVAIARG